MVALFRKGEIGCKAETLYAQNWEHVRQHLQNLLKMGYKLNTEAVKKIDTDELTNAFKDHQPQLFPLYPSIPSSDETPPEEPADLPSQKSLKDLEKSRQRKADW